MFHLDWIFVLIPKSVKAAIAEIVMLIAVSQLFVGLQGMLFEIGSTGANSARFVFGLVFGIPATIVFFSTQSRRAHYSELETLERYYKSEKPEQPRPTAEPWHMPDDQNTTKKQP